MSSDDTAIAARVREHIAGARAIAVLTGAGMSAESGIATFRGAGDSLWSRFDPQRLASPEGWAEDRALVWGWYRWRMAQVRRARPNAGHLALAQLAARKPLALVTQNVDDLHERGGARDVVHLHGELFALRCHACAREADAEAMAQFTAALDSFADTDAATAQRTEPLPCPHCAGHLRPGVVWFGEALPPAAWQRAVDAVQRCDLLLVIGTSGAVYPAAQLPQIARQHGATVVEINPQPGAAATADVVWRTTAAVGLPLVCSDP